MKRDLVKFFQELEDYQSRNIEQLLFIQNTIPQPYRDKYSQIIQQHSIAGYNNGYRFGHTTTEIVKRQTSKKSKDPLEVNHIGIIDNITTTIQTEFLSIEQVLDEHLSPSTPIFEISQTNQEVMEQYQFKASQRTLNRIDERIMGVIEEGYNTGFGATRVKQTLRKEYELLTGYEAERIARTTINTAQNLGTQQSYTDDGIQYMEWSAALDKRTRHSHRLLHGEVIRVGETFSNKLRYPGDPTGKLSEFINCRCTTLPIITTDEELKTL